MRLLHLLYLTPLFFFLLSTSVANAQSNPQQILEDIAGELCENYQAAMAGTGPGEDEDFVLFTLMCAKKLSYTSKVNFWNAYGVNLNKAPILERPFWGLMATLVEQCPAAMEYFIYRGQFGDLYAKTLARPAFDSIMASTALKIEEDMASRQSPLPFSELVYSKINFDEMPASDIKLLLVRKMGHSFLPAVLAKHNPAVVSYSLNEIGESFEAMEKVRRNNALPTTEDLNSFCAQMQQLDTIQTDDDYLIPATELAEAYLKDHNLSFDFASNKPIFIKYYVNKIWVERKAACPHFVEILEAYNNRRR